MIARNAQRLLAVAPRSARASGELRRAEQRAHGAARPQPLARSAARHLLSPRRAAGLSLVEMLIALAITAMLLTATMVATDASFKAYAAAAEAASAQSSTRMVVNRLLTLIRTSTAHGPLATSTDPAWPVAVFADADGSPVIDTLQSDFLELRDQTGRLLRIEYREDERKVWVIEDSDGNGSFADASDEEYELIGGVTAAGFYTHIRTDDNGDPALNRGSVDLTVMPDEDNTLALENENRQAIRVIASTRPRRLD